MACRPGRLFPIVAKSSIEAPISNLAPNLENASVYDKKEVQGLGLYERTSRELYVARDRNETDAAKERARAKGERFYRNRIER
jgi:hypothetical protein